MPHFRNGLAIDRNLAGSDELIGVPAGSDPGLGNVAVEPDTCFGRFSLAFLLLNPAFYLVRSILFEAVQAVFGRAET